MGAVENPWDTHAEAYDDWVARRERGLVPGAGMDGLLGVLLDLLGDVAGLAALDAGCGSGFLARILAARGASVTGIDLSPRLIAKARERDSDGAIDFRVADLSQPLPDLAGRFDCIGSYLALNDVADYVGFAESLAALARPGGRLAVALNNHYSLPVRGHLTDYFASGSRGVYGGMSAALGGELRYYQRTMGDYMDAFLGVGWRLVRLVDVPAAPRDDLRLPPGSRFPLFTVLAFDKPEWGGGAQRGVAAAHGLSGGDRRGRERG